MALDLRWSTEMEAPRQSVEDTEQQSGPRVQWPTSSVFFSVLSLKKNQSLDKVGHAASATKDRKRRCVWTCGGGWGPALPGYSVHPMQSIHPWEVRSGFHSGHRLVQTPPQEKSRPSLRTASSFCCHSNPVPHPGWICFLSQWICLGGTFYLNRTRQYVVTLDWSLSFS